MHKQICQSWQIMKKFVLPVFPILGLIDKRFFPIAIPLYSCAILFPFEFVTNWIDVSKALFPVIISCVRQLDRCKSTEVLVENAQPPNSDEAFAQTFLGKSMRSLFGWRDAVAPVLQYTMSTRMLIFKKDTVEGRKISYIPLFRFVPKMRMLSSSFLDPCHKMGLLPLPRKYQSNLSFVSMRLSEYSTLVRV